MSFSDFDHRRIQTYLGDRVGQDSTVHHIGRATDVVFCGASEPEAEIQSRYAFRYAPALFAHLYKMYIEQAQKIVARVNPLAQFCVYPDDLRAELPVPVLTKSRRISGASRCTLLPLNYQRHWGDVGSVDRLDIPFAQKDDRLVWRGTTTGKFMPDNSAEPYSSRAYVYTHNGRNPNIDIGFSNIVQIDPNWPVLALLRAKLKPPLTIAAQLRSKYLLSLEGNDVASGLKWMLYSNSVVLMPAPSCETWACESMLVPYEHFVPVAADLSDLDQVYEWCRAHEKECEEIAQNGRAFIQNFLDPDREVRICNAVVAEYLRLATFVPNPGDLQPIRLDREALRRQAQGLISGGELSQAERLLAGVAESQDDWRDEYGDPILRKDLVKFLLAQDRLEDARKWAVEQTPPAAAGWYEILFARALENHGRPSEALPHWLRFLEANPGHLEAQDAVRRLARLRAR